MCKNSKVISNSKNGQITICNGCGRYNITFNNILLQFHKNELQNFKKHINNINVDYWLDFYAKTTKKRKIPVSTNQDNLILFFTEEEFYDLKLLLSIKENKKELLSVYDINYPLILN